eukprot:996981-Amphidinium_carterae.1
MYGVADPHTAANTALAQRLFRAVDEWRCVHKGQKLCIMGDFNVTLDEDFRVASWLTSGHLIDAIQCFQPEHTRAATHVAGRAIDHVVISDTLQGQLKSASVDPVWRFPAHRAISCCISLESLAKDTDSRGVSLRVPQRLPISPLVKSHLAEHDSDLGKAALEQALVNRDVDAALSSWSWRWEQLTIRAAEVNGIEASPLMEGRSLPDCYAADERVPRSHAAPTQAHRPIEVRQLRRSLNMARTWLQESTRDIPWAQAQQYNDREKVLLKRLRKVHSIEHAFISQVTVAELSDRLKKLTQQHDRERITQWRRDMMTLGAACRFVRGPFPPRPTSIVDEEGKLVVGYNDMDVTLTRFWQGAAQPKHTSLEEVSKYVHARADSWQQAPELTLTPFTAESLQRLCAKVKKKTAPGPGSWRALELAQLPHSSMSELAAVMNLVLATGQTPAIWKMSWTSFIPKNESKQVHCMRPITVTALTWRLFAKHVYQSLGPDLDAHLHSAQCGARLGMGSVEAALAAKKFADLCVHRKCKGHMVQLDVTKCFNGLSTSDALYVLGRMGCPPSLCQLLERHCSSLCTRNKLSTVWGGRHYSTVRGCPQGCPLSTLMANALLRLVPPQDQVPGVTCSMYLDDCTLMSTSRTALVEATAKVLACLRNLGLEVNAAKSTYCCFGGTACDEGELSDLCVGDFQIKASRRTTMLGFDLHTDEVHSLTEGQRKRADLALMRLSRIAKLPGGPAQKQLVLSLMVSSLWRWAPLGQTPHASSREGLRRRVTSTLNGPSAPRAQAHEVFYGILLKGHLLEPSWTQLHSMIMLAWKLFKTHSDALDLLCAEPQPGTLLHDMDAMLHSVGMARE